LGKIADLLTEACGERDRLGVQPGLSTRVVAEGEGWTAESVTCTFRPNDTSFEERHVRYRIAVVGAGTFECRSADGRELLTPGSLLLGNAGRCFECGHAHGDGDCCLAFGYAPDYFERLAADAGVRGRPRLRAVRVPPVRVLAPLVAETCAAWFGHGGRAAHGWWEDLVVRLAAATVRHAAQPTRRPRSPVNAERGIARAIMLVERDPGAALTLRRLAGEATLSPYHFLRTFARVTGLTPHQYLMRARLRAAALKLAAHDAPVIDIALDCGFRDVSNFNRAFRAEFGGTPLEHRTRLRRRVQ